MTSAQIIFLIAGAVTLISALMVVTRRNLVHAALFLVLALFGVAVLFVLLEAGFLAVVLVLVYIGAIAILMIFAIMVTRGAASEESKATNSNWAVAAVIAILLFEALVVILNLWPGFRATAAALPDSVDTLQELGSALVSPDAYILPFEVASVLLVAALIGAIFVAWRRGGKEEK
jgi:NADH-quinone oxidoreductase subunit J